MLSSHILLLFILSVVYSIPVDNNVEGEPEIECGPTSITINFNTRNPFMGHVFVKGLYDQQNCRNDEGGRQVAGIELAFDTCNVARTRSLNPKGVFVTTTVVISFHPQFVTKVDGAYKIQCFYMEADKTVSTGIEGVSDLTTLMQTALVPMPICKYEILAGGPTGEPIQYASVGQQVYHKWTCESETQDTFCAVVHSCTVDDGNGDRLLILNEDGCALDKFILNNLEYPEDLQAGQEAHVYKYADRNQIFYQCQISITVKEPHQECARPQCAEPTTFGAKKAGEAAVHSGTAAAAAEGGGGGHEGDGSTYQPSSPTRAPSPSSSPQSPTQRPRFASRSSPRNTSGTVSSAEHETAQLHGGSSSIFSTSGESPSVVEEDVANSRERTFRLLRKKRSTEDGVKMFSLDNYVTEMNEMNDDMEGKKEEHRIKKRFREISSWDGHTIDVRAELTALDYTDAELALSDLLRARRSSKYGISSRLVSSLSSDDICVSPNSILALSALLLALFATAITLTIILFRPSRKYDDHDC